MKLAFLGMGIMGAPMAANLARAGHAVAVWNRTPGRIAAAQQRYAALQQARVAATVAEAVEGADVALSILADPAALASVLEGEAGAVAHLGQGATLVEMSTVDPATTRRIACAAQQRGIRFVDAPVIGSRHPAEQGTLVVLAAGEATDVERMRPVLGALGRVMHVGPTGAGASLKLVANGLAAHMITGFSSVMVMARALGLDPEVTLEAIQSSAFASPMFAHRGPKLLARDFSPDFTLRLGAKDWRLAIETAAAAGCAMPTLAACLESARAAIDAGHGDEDLGAIVKAFEAQAGLLVETKR